MKTEHPTSSADRLLDLSLGPLLGRIGRLDRRRIDVELTDPALTALVTVSDLVALPTGSEFVIGMVEALTPRLPGGGQINVDTQQPGVFDPPVDLRIMPIGTFRPRGETTAGEFVRGASTFPHSGGTAI